MSEPNTLTREKLKELIFEGMPKESRSRLERMLSDILLAVGVVWKLRAPNGCPWDREQTPKTLRPYLIEEAYEVLDVLDEDALDIQKFREELGDLLLQILLHAQIQDESAQFSFGDVSLALAQKLVSRHPHVFGEVKVSGSDEVLKNWEQLKKKEGKQGLLGGLPKNLPSLQRAARIGEKAHRIGFDWKDWQGSMTKVDEELLEVKEAIASGDAVEIENELGDLFFSLCNLSRHLKINPEDAHRKAIAKFETRFRKLEKYCEENAIDIHTSSLEELDRVWDVVKKL